MKKYKKQLQVILSVIIFLTAIVIERVTHTAWVYPFTLLMILGSFKLYEKA